MIRVETDAKGITVWKYVNLQDGRREYQTYDGKTRTVKPNDPAPWWFVLSAEDAKALGEALGDFLKDDSPELGYLQGKLEVMEAYLADMRSIAIPESLQ